jgi:hypothetical protein
VTVGLIDALIAIARVLAQRDLQPVEVREALKDLASDSDMALIINAATAAEAIAAGDAAVGALKQI